MRLGNLGPVSAPSPVSSSEELNRTEQDIRALCAEVLSRPVEKVKLHRSFLAQGGDSLLAIKLMARCRNTGYTINVQDLLQARSIREFCQCVQPKADKSGVASPSTGSHGSLSSDEEMPGTPLTDTDELPLVEIPLADLDAAVIAKLGEITPDPIQKVENVFPCSPTQEVFLAAQQVHPEMYHVSVVLELKPAADTPLDLDRLRLAWEQLVQRHPSLRTIFIDSAKRPGHFDQVVLKSSIAPLRIIHESDPATISSRRPVSFPIYQATHNATIYHSSSTYFRLDISHALVDGESFYVILQGLRQAYQYGFLGPSPMQYQAFVSHQQQLSTTAAVSYWSKYLSGAEASFFPSLGDVQHSDLSTARFTIPTNHSQFCSTLDVTVANICQVAWALVLRAYTASEEVCFSYASSGRQAPLPGIEETVGTFADTMIFRMRMAGGMSVAEALGQAKKDFVQGFAHPSALIRGDEQVARNFARLRGNTFMSCQRAWKGELAQGDGFEFDVIDAVNPSEFDLSVNVQISQDALDVSVDFWRSRLDQATVDSVTQCFRKAICCILESQSTPLSALDVIPPEHIAQLQNWCGEIPARVESRIQDRVYQQALARPDTTAIHGWDGDFTYRELDDEANKLAAHLATLGVGPEIKVPMVFEKSKWAIVSQLAILKAGGCVVPLGVKQPMSRTEIILRDIEATLILTDTQNAARFTDMLRVIAVNKPFMETLPSSEVPLCAATPDNSAFVIYTSGSTGVPKGVVLPHASLCTSLHHLARNFRVNSDTRMVQFSAYTFDISIQDIYTTLQNGGCLCVISEEDRIVNLGSAMCSYGVTCAGLTSTVAGLVSPEEVPTLKTLVLLGEAVKAAVVDNWISHAAVFNAYGPSECSIQSSINELTPECDALNIGYALAGALWIVDANDCNRLVPIGAPGELLIEGPLLARGYLNDPKKTDAVFINDPTWVSKYGLGDTRRLYRTGDLVRQNWNGSITYIGRRDTQIKVRGQRVEVGEIEHHLIQHEDVLDAAIVFPRQGPCKDRLVGLLTLRTFLTPGWAKSDVIPVSGDQVASAKIRASQFASYLSSRVPDHMIPKVWIPLTSMMPQNDSGKLDRKRLGIWTEEMENTLYETLTTTHDSQNETATGTPFELQMREIWAKVLKLPENQVPTHDRSFLGCGGDSIAAMQVVSQCRAQGISIGVRDVLQSKSIAQLVLGADTVQNQHQIPISGLASEKLDLLQDILPRLGFHLDDVEDIYPCSPIQQGILVSQAKSPSAYIIQQSFEIRPAGSGVPVNAEGIAKAWRTLVDRHSILRTVFLPAVSNFEHGLFDQVVLKSYHGSVKVLQCSDDEIESRLAIKTDVSVGSLSHPGHELTVYSTPSGRVYAQLVINHALVDASSLGLLQKELIQAYDGVLPASNTAPSYSTYISYLQQTPAHEAVKYWSGRLAGAEPCYLPALTESGFPGPASKTAADRQPLRFLTFELENSEALQALTKTHGVTAATIFQLAWALVLSQYTGSQDVSFGYLTSGRDAPIDGVNDLVGPLINIMVTRVHLNPESGMGSALQQVQNDFFEGFNHQRAALVDIWHSLRLEGQSLFNTSLSYRHAPLEIQDGASIALDLVTVEDPTEYDANVNVFASEDKVSVMLQYSPVFMSADGASRVLGSLLQAVQSIVGNLESSLRDAYVVTKEDLEKLCRLNSPTVEETGKHNCIHDLVHRQRLAQPEAMAVCAWDGKMTYQELEDAADQLAHHLATLGVGPEVMVALCLEKSRWAAVAQLAVLKAGGVVVSVNPKHPAQRLQGILTDIKAKVMLTTRPHVSRFRDTIAHVIPVDQDFLGQLPAPLDPAPQTAKPENAAFVIYTSGSTGTPKGVVLTHSSLCASFQAHGQAYGMSSSTRTVQFAAYTFDASISDIWATITHGGCVCVISEEERMNNLQGAIESYGANLAQLTPTVAGLLDPPKLSTLKTLVLGGEAVKAAMIEGFLTDGRVDVINGYGPSECSVYTTCNGPLDFTMQSSNIGRVLVGGVWVVNNTYKTVSPIGGVGELWIEGPLLGRGYLNDKAKTDASFVTDPSWTAGVPSLQGRRFYRTGDLVRQNAAGEILYIGRKDTQIKIRGQRVEIGEIEHKVKKTLPSVFITVAVSLVMPGGNTGNPTLAVAVEMHSDGARPSAESSEASSENHLVPMSDELKETFSRLHASLTEALPSYMVPRFFFPFSRLPSTSSGKLDRRALRQFLESLAEHTLAQYTLSCVAGRVFPPTTATERELQALWADVLGVELDRVGVQDHFLYSGGDSFTAMRLVSKADGAGLPLTVADVFLYPKLAEMADFIDQQRRTAGGEAGGEQGQKDEDGGIPCFALWKEVQGQQDGEASSLNDALSRIAEQCGLSVEDIEDVYPCTPLQEGLMAVTAQQPGAYVNRWVYKIPSDLDCTRFKESWQTVARAAPLLRTRIILGETSGALQVVVRDDLIWFSANDLHQYLEDDDVAGMIYGLPLVRLAIAGPVSGQQYFVFTAHHSVYDGWSWARLFDAATRVYHQNDSAIASAPFNSFIKYLGACDEGTAESFWQSQLAGEIAASFPAQPKPNHQPSPTEMAVYELSISQNTGHITPAALLRAAWALVVFSQSSTNVIFGAVLTGRTAPVSGIFDMLAPTITTVPVHILVNKVQSVIDYLAAVQQQAVSMMPFEHTGLQHISRYIGAPLDIGHLFTVQPAEVRTSLMTAPPLGLELHNAPNSGADDYGLCVECIMGQDGDSTKIQVNARFDEAMIPRTLLGRLLGRFQHILAQLTRILQGDRRTETTRIGDLEMVSPEEIGLLSRWNGQIPKKRPAFVHELVREAGIDRPAAPAICSWDGDITHGELDILAEKLACRLVGLGVGPEAPVPLCFDKSKWAIVSMLAILKAGGVVVPIAAEPAQRVQAVLNDTQAQVVLTSPNHASRFPGVPHVLAVDDGLLASLSTSPERIRSQATPDNAAFIIYTSGSTGLPKGVVLEHSSMSTSMQTHGARFGMGPETRAFQFASFTFDISLHDMLTTLQFGGCVCMPSEEERMGDVAGAMKRMRVNYTFLPPRILPTINPLDILELQTLVVGGEATQAEHIEPWLGRMRVFNAYGPAECCIISTCIEFGHDADTLNIGHALAGGLWVVDEADPNRLLPIGSIGELIIEGPLLARGYLNNPEKSASAFISNPSWLVQYGLSTDANSESRRFYRTGDLVKQNDDGSFTYVGRRDSQVKIRGQRVEIDEIEHHLKRNSSVADAAVLHPMHGPAKSRLVAVLNFDQLKVQSALEVEATTPDQAPLAASLASSVREGLIQYVPSYMVPSTWVSVGSMPQNASNKIDRQKLLQWLESMSSDQLERIMLSQEVDDTPEDPTDDLQRQLRAILVEVLGKSADKIAMNRSFLSMGGDSISAMQVVSRSRAQHGISVTVRDVLQATSIAQLARRASGYAKESPADQPRKPLRHLTSEGLSRLHADIVSQVCIVSLDEVEDVYPCSPIQQGIVMSQIRGHATYNVQQICEIQASEQTSPVDVDRLSQAWCEVVSRHPILRTTFVQSSISQEQMFYQVALRQFNPQVRIIRHGGTEDSVTILLREEPSKYADGQPPHHLTLCVSESGATYAKLEVSHALVDASSLGLVLRDVLRAYDGTLPDTPPPTYGTYVDFLQQRPEDESLAFWSNRLTNAQPCHLPPSTTPATKTRSLKTVVRQIESTEALHVFRDNHGVTIANMVQLAWAIVLSRYTGSSDIIFGYLANGRDAPVAGADDIVGPMINMMVSRIRLGELPSIVAQAARQVQDEFFEAFAHQRTSLGSIHHALHLSEQSLFNTTVSFFRRSPEHAPNSSSLTIKSISGEDPTEYDANLSILASDDTIELSLQYSTSFMDDESARLVLDNLRHTLLSIATNAEASLDELNTLNPSDVEKLRLWNTAPLPMAGDCVHHRIQQQCLSQPDAQAVCGWDGSLSYADLDALSDQLAWQLNELGIHEESMVGLCFEKSVWTTVAMLAVIKAGGVIVPLGMQLPQQRHRLILDSTKAAVVLTSEACGNKFEDVEALHKLTVNAALFMTLPKVAGPPPRPDLTAENAAVVIYTSGSTGLPKGVVLTHGALSTSLDTHGAKLGLGVNTRALQYSAYVFDLSLLDIFGTLRFGGCVCIASEEDRMDPKRLAVVMEAMKVNSTVLTPTVASVLDPTKVPSLGTLILAGEALQPAVVEMWSSHAILFNGYGPAECTVLSTINGPLVDKDRARNVGKPLAVTTWVVDPDDHNRLASVGAVGELLVEGPLVSRGYLHDPERTAAAFITGPDFISRYGFTQPSSQVQRRLYRTGDLVRQSPRDGSITYIGRTDGQVKIRGQRLEVGEIEYWAKSAFTQAQTVVADLIRPHARNGEPILAVALELSEQSPIGSDKSLLLPLTDSLRRSLSVLQESLTQALPSYMVPAVYVPLRRMPLTASGKLDRKELRALLSTLGEAQLSQYALIESSGPARPLTDAESQLRDLWTSVLCVSSEIMPASHFFRLGGDSVTAMRLAAAAADTKPAIRLNVADIFRNPVLENMARIVAGRGGDAEGPMDVTEADTAPFSLMPDSWNKHDGLVRAAVLCGVAREAIEDTYPCTPLQEGLLALTEREPSAYIGRWVFRMDDDVDVERLRSAWQEVSRLAPILRTRILAGDHTEIGVQVVIRGLVTLTTISSDLESHMSRDEAQPMGFGTELMRLAVVTTPSSDRFFVWTAHHSIYDGWSSRKLLEAVRDVYLGQAAPTFVPYTRFIQYVQQVNSRPDVDEYWRTELGGELGLGFPTMPPNHQPRPGSTIAITVAAGNSLAAAVKSTITTATFLRAAWALVLSHETGSQDVVFAAPLSGRTAPVPGILDIAAPTLATVPVHISVSRGISVADYLDSIQQQAAEMIPFEHVGLQHITRVLDGKTLDINHLFIIQPFSDRPGQDATALQGLEPLPSMGASTFHKYPLVIECNTGSGSDASSVGLEASFDEVVLSPDRVMTILERLKHVFVQLRAAASSSGPCGDAQLASIDIMGPEDIGRICRWNQWSETSLPASGNKRVHELVEEQALAQPSAQAVCAWDGELSYAELDDLSLRLAQRLITLGVGPESLVPMSFEKSVWAVVAQLAILKAGGVVVPIGHKHPLQRIRDIVEATSAKIIICSKHSSQFDGLASHVLVVDDAFMHSLSSDQRRPACETISPDNAAFVIFTSGSTGVPKGVVLEHRALVTSLQAEAELFAGPKARTLQFSSYTFDISIAETFVPLIMGGTVCVPSEEGRVSNLAASMEEMDVSLAYLTPTVVGLLRPQQVPSLKTLVLIGEALKPNVVSEWIDNVQVFNAYGPAECSILSTSSRRITDARDAPSIGTAIAGSNLWVVDPSDYHCLVPIGLPGELLIEGPLLARGYLGDEKKTAESFVTDPAWLGHFNFGPTQGRRFYRTGDLVQQAPDGSITYLGRRDTQVKLHGQRLEIGEIEHWVKKLMGAQAGLTAAGLLTPDDPGNLVPEPVLAIAVEVESTETSEPRLPQERITQAALDLLPLTDDLRDLFDRLRSSLAEVLPSYMVPQLYIPTGKLPTTDSGKLNHRLVWASIKQSGLLAQYSLAQREQRIAPRTKTERQLQELWAKMLRVSPQDVSASANFFLSGGDSISAMRLVARAREAGVSSLTVADVFRHPVLSDLATVLDTRQADSARPSACYRPFSALKITEPSRFATQCIEPLLLERRTVVDAAPVTDFQALSVVSSLRASRDLLAHVTLDGEGRCDVDKWRESCWELIRRHDILRTAYVFVENQLVQAVLQEWRPEIAHLETDDAVIDEFTKQLVAHDMSSPPSLGRPFVEFTVITSPSRHRILFRLSHAEYDAISMSYFLEELRAIFVGAETSPETSSFLHYMSTLSADQETLKASRSYWCRLLSGSTMLRIAPRNQPPLSRLIHHATRSVPLPTQEVCSAKNITAATLVRAAWGLTLARFTGMNDVIFGEVVSGRNTGQPVAAQAAGCCANVVPVRTTLQSDASVRDLLDQVQAQHVARLQHETVGFREILRVCAEYSGTEGGDFYTTRINHLDRAPQWTLNIGEAIYRVGISLPEGAEDPSDIAITSVSHVDHIDIAFGYRDGAVSAEVADQLLSCMCAAIELLANGLSGELLLGSLLGEEGDKALGGVKQLIQEEEHVEEGDIRRGRDLIEAGYLAFELQQRGEKVTIDDVLRGSL